MEMVFPPLLSFFSPLLSFFPSFSLPFTTEHSYSLGCGHGTCEDCWQNNIKTCLSDYRPNFIECPIMDCSLCLLEEDVEELGLFLILFYFTLFYFILFYYIFWVLIIIIIIIFVILILFPCLHRRTRSAQNLPRSISPGIFLFLPSTLLLYFPFLIAFSSLPLLLLF